MKTIPKNWLLTVVISLCGITGLFAQQLELSGTLLNAENELPIKGVQIVIPTQFQDIVTDENGSFKLRMEFRKIVELNISHEQYEGLVLTLQPIDNTHDAGIIYMTPLNEESQVNLPTIVLNEQEFGDDDNGAEDVSGLLSASHDPFARVAAYDLSWGRFRLRGLNSENQDMVMNGIPTNDLETGRVLWSMWGGLNDAMRARRDVINLNVNDFSFGGLAGAGYINIRPSAMRTGGRLSYAMSNANYRHRLMGFYNSGINEKGWGLAVSASKRYAEEGYVEGTFYDAWSYFVSIEKRINEKHSINIAGFGAYNKRGRSSAAVQEAYDLRDPDREELYNPNWGYQAGEKRNARVNTSFQPIFLLTHDWQVSQGLSIHTGGFYRTGRYGTSALDWNNANDPRPDYYRYLPSWEEDPVVAEAVAEKWRTDESVRQLDWDRLININRNAFETIFDVDGIEGNDVSGKRSRYIVEERRYDPNVLSLSSYANATINDQFEIYGGISFVKSRTDNYKLVQDLLGGDFHLDVDKYAESDFANPNLPAPDIIQNDLLHPNRLVTEGDVTGYDYEIHVEQMKAWIQAKWETRKIIFYAGGQVGQSSFWRNGNFQNGLHAETSLGESEKQDDFIYGAKAGLTYKIDGRNYLYINAVTGENGARARDGFLSPRVDNQLNPYNDTWKYVGFDAGYQIRSPFIKARISIYRNEAKDHVRSLLFYNDFKNTFGNYIIGNLDYIYEGVEGGFELKVSPTMSLSGGFSFSDNRINDRAISSVIDDRSLDIIDADQTLYVKGYKVSGIPNTVANLGITYRSPKYWWIGVSGNYFDDTYIDISPVRRTSEAIELLDPGSELYESIRAQEEVGGEFVTHLIGGYSYRIKHGKYIRFFISVNNLLDNRDFISGGYEQLRFNTESRDPDAFPSRYYYNYGRTYFASITYQF